MANAECQHAGSGTCTVADQVWYPALSSIPFLSKHNVLFALKQCVNGVTMCFSISITSQHADWAQVIQPPSICICFSHHPSLGEPTNTTSALLDHIAVLGQGFMHTRPNCTRQRQGQNVVLILLSHLLKITHMCYYDSKSPICVIITQNHPNVLL